MKTLILIRHAKSDWPENTNDFDRPLANRGLKDAANMAEFLKDKISKVDQIIASPARRTMETAEFFAEKYGLSVETDDKLYHPSENNFMSVITNLPDNTEKVIVFSHNNGISNFANFMTGDIIHFSTCAVGVFEIMTEKWQDFDKAEKKLAGFFMPKKL